MAGPPNVLLLVCDAARRDAFTPYADDTADVTTPTIAALAAHGKAVEHAYATAPWTLPSHTAMFTGALAAEFGLDQAPGGDPRSVAATLAPHRDRFLASVLSAHGYATRGYSANLWVSPHSGLDAGFEHFQYAPSHRLERSLGDGANGRLARLHWTWEGLRARSDAGAEAIGTDLRTAITAADPATPHFWFVNLVEAHSPYLPPRPFNDLPAEERVRAALDCRRYLNFEAICIAAAGGLAVPAPVLDTLAHLHRRAVTYMDSWLNEVLVALEQRGMLENTLIIVTSDHGENFGEDGLLAHGFGLGDELIHVPLVAAGPGAELFSGDRAMSLRELPGLIAAATGIDGHPFGEPGDGIAVARSTALCPADDPKMIAFAERWSLSDAQVARLATDRWLATDGHDTVTVINDTRSGENAQLIAALERMQAAPAGTAGSPPATAAQASDGGADAEEIAALEAQMRLLGYL